MVIISFYFGMCDNLIVTAMEQDKINLLIEDLSARLPYGVRIDLNGIKGTLHNIYVHHRYEGNQICKLIGEIDFFNDGNLINVEHFKPCLIPLSNITKEQENEFKKLSGLREFPNTEIIKWCYENHIDIKGLIPLDLAIDATNLDIY